MTDSKLGQMPLLITIDQAGSVLDGGWTDREGDIGPINGLVYPNGTMSANFEIDNVHCHGVFRGQWVYYSPNPSYTYISGTFYWVGCRPGEGGTFSVDQECGIPFHLPGTPPVF